MFFDILFLPWMCSDDVNADPGGRFRNTVDEGRNFVYLKTRLLQKITVLGLAILLIFGGRVSANVF